jgi:hypothetical protein
MPTTFRQAVQAWWYQRDLNRLARLFGTDKWGSHWYTQHYQRYFDAIRRTPLTLLEIGIGGYDESNQGGNSLRMWKHYFRKGQIIGIDVYDKTVLREPRIEVRQCHQTDAVALRALAEEFGGFDIIIDDGSHRNTDVIGAFEILFPLLKAPGIYAVEDMQTAYWSRWGGGKPGAPGTSMAFFKRLIDALNHQEYPEPSYSPTYYDRHVLELAFFHNLVVIRKGHNSETSNLPPSAHPRTAGRTGANISSRW